MPKSKAPAARAARISPRLPFRQSIDGCREAAIGRHGLSDFLLERYLRQLEAPLRALKDNYRTGRLALLTIPEESADIAAAKAALDRLSVGARLIVFFGTGGSGLGGQTLAQVAGWNIPGGADVSQQSRPRTRFYDNLDPATLTGALAGLDLATTRFVAISKSGGTTETLAQIVVTIDAIRKAGLEQDIPRLLLGVTEPDESGERNGLRRLLARYGAPIVEHPTGIGGRFSCLTNVGLLPAMARGLDPMAIRAGAREVVEAMLAASSPADLPAAVSAAVAVALAKEKSVRTLVMMPYVDRLAKLGHWFAQLWSESLGKGGQGTSAIAALGPLDQHSQLQLFMDGPHEHLITVIRCAVDGTGATIDRELAELAGAGYMAGRTVGDIVSAQSHAIAEALARAGRAVRTIDLEQLDERTIGALLMHLMIETILAGRLMGVDPFDQPAVELAKVLTRERLAAKR
ncbi:MAG: glucose-6-phosphate isomerase [Pseudomonadota bacterium]